MGNFEKLVVMTVLFLSMLVLAVSFRSGPDEARAGDGPLAELDSARAANGRSATRTDGLLDSSVRPSERPQVQPERGATPAPAQQPAPAQKKQPVPVLPGTILLSAEGLREPTFAGADFLLYTPVEGDRWDTLAARYYGDPLRARLLRQNNEELADVQPIPGQPIVVPLRDTTQPAPDREPARPTRRPSVLTAEDVAALTGKGDANAKPAAKPADKPGTYTVKSGDTLSEIAQAVYGKSARWRDIFEANKDKLVSADVLEVGQTLIIP